MSLGRLMAVAITALAVITVLILPLSEEIYCWIDEKGAPHLSDRKPVGVDEGAARNVDSSRPGRLTSVEEAINKHLPVSGI